MSADYLARFLVAFIMIWLVALGLLKLTFWVL